MPESDPIIGRLLRSAAASLAVDAPRLEAEVLLGHVLGRPRAWLFAHADEGIDEAACARFTALLARRRAGEPIAYLTGLRDFHGLTLAVAPGVLIPRPETELLVELALAEIDAGSRTRVLDLGTGSGAIALALATARSGVRVTAVERSAAAAAIAAGNIERAGLDNVALVMSDWFTALSGASYDLIVSNPPYIARGELASLPREVREHDPRRALDGGSDGLVAYRALAHGMPPLLVEGGAFVLETGYRQADEVAELMQSVGLQPIRPHQTDLAGISRVVWGRKPES